MSLKNKHTDILNITETILYYKESYFAFLLAFSVILSAVRAGRNSLFLALLLVLLGLVLWMILKKGRKFKIFNTQNTEEENRRIIVKIIMKSKERDLKIIEGDPLILESKINRNIVRREFRFDNGIIYFRPGRTRWYLDSQLRQIFYGAEFIKLLYKNIDLKT